MWCFLEKIDDMLQQLVQETNRFAAAQNNNHTFEVIEAEMKRFCGTCNFPRSGYRTLPQQDFY